MLNYMTPDNDTRPTNSTYEMMLAVDTGNRGVDDAKKLFGDRLALLRSLSAEAGSNKTLIDNAITSGEAALLYLSDGEINDALVASSVFGEAWALLLWRTWEPLGDMFGPIDI